MQYLSLEKLVKTKGASTLILKRLLPFLLEYFSENAVVESLKVDYSLIVVKKCLSQKREMEQGFVKQVFDQAKEHFLEHAGKNDLGPENEGERRAQAQNIDLIKRVEAKEKILCLLNELPGRQKELCWKRFFERKNAPQIAVDQELTVGEVNKELLLALETILPAIKEMGKFVQIKTSTVKSPFDENITDMQILKHRYITGEMSAGDLEQFMQAAAEDNETKQSLRALYHLETWMIKVNRYVRGAELSEQETKAFIASLENEASRNTNSILPSFHLPTVFLGLGILFLIILIFTIFYIVAY